MTQTRSRLALPASAVLLTMLAISSPHVQAQSKIQCQLNSAGIYQAPLAWQNTLGASRANAMCGSAASQAAPAQTTPTAQPQIAPMAFQPPTAQFTINEGERASEVLRRWAARQGYSFVWDAPAQSDLSMSMGSIGATDMTDAMNKLISALNIKVTAKRKANGPDSQFAFPVEALAYSNKVIAIAVKQ